MSNSCDYYVYIHRKVLDDQPFYIGKGKGNRARSTKSRSNFWKKVTAKYDWYVEIFAENLLERDALDLEIALIKQYGRRDNGTGILVNLTDGGESTINLSKESRQKISDKAKGRTVSEDLKKELSKKNKGRILKNPYIHIGKYSGEELQGFLSDILKELRIDTKDQRLEFQRFLRGNVNQYNGWYLNPNEKLFEEIEESKTATPFIEYTFISKNKIIITTKAKFSKMVDFKISPLFSGTGNRRVCKGWAVLRDGETIDTVLDIIDSIGAPRYKFYNEDTDDTFIGRTSEFQQYSAISKSRLTDLFRKQIRSTVDGWIILERLNGNK